MVQPPLDFYYGERRKAEASTTALNCGDYFVDIIADDAEADILCVLLNDAAKSSLRGRGHHVCFVQHYKFETLRKQRPSLCELLNLFADDVDASVIGGI